MRKVPVLVAVLLLLPPASSSAAPNDEHFWLQWGLKKIRAEAAWTVSKGAGSIVAVVDTGVHTNHPDLKGARMLTGRDFVAPGTSAADENGHGTLIAGIVAATTSNEIGVASVAPSAKILPVRVLDEDGTGTSSTVAEGIEYAVDQGADVINLSLAEDGPGGPLGDLLSDPAIDDAIKDAARRGRTVVIAAGNDREGGENETAYDATVDGVLVVGSSTKGDKRAAYSNYGSGLDLLAPGGGSATDPSSGACTGDNSIASTWWKANDGAVYGTGCGTSMAVAFVAGVAAQLHARGLTNRQVVRRILDTADDLGPKGRDDTTGYGRLNAARALGASTTVTQPTRRSSPRPQPTRSTPRSIARAQSSDAAEPSSPSATPSPISSPSPRETEDVQAIAPLPERAAPGKGWPVPTAALLAGLVALAHYWRWVRRART